MIQFELSPKQQLGFHYLTACDWLNELVFGGGAGGGKTYLGSFWIITAATRLFPGSAWLIARKELKALKRTTMRTFFAVCSELGMRRDVHYHFNQQDMIITFANESVVFFAEFDYYPSDPQYDRIGSYDLTGGWIDEAQEVTKDAKDALQFRYRVLEGKGWSTVPKTLYTCNPGKNWIYTDFWKPIVNHKKEVKGKQFITSLYTDNPYIDQEKLRDNVLQTKNKVKIERLLHGNFEYDDDPACLYNLDQITDLFTNKAEKSDDKYLISDCSRKGRDDFIIDYWEGLQMKKRYVLDYATKSDSDKARRYIEKLIQKHGVRKSRVLLDSDGVGGPIVDAIGCKGFVNNASPIKSTRQKRKEKDDSYSINYVNLKTQCAFKLVELMERGVVGIDEDAMTVEQKQNLIDEMQTVKQKNIDKDGKVGLIGKDQMKETLGGRSPDGYDTLMMRCYYEIKPKPSFVLQSY